VIIARSGIRGLLSGDSFGVGRHRRKAGQETRPLVAQQRGGFHPIVRDRAPFHEVAIIFPGFSLDRPFAAQLMRAKFINQHRQGEKAMTRSKSVLTWCLRAVWREDPALRRIERLKSYRTNPVKAAVPVFFTQKVTLG
jgi:hypothetical protein